MRRHQSDSLESGTPDNPDELKTAQSRWKIPLWFGLITMIVVLLSAALILAKVAGPLYGLLFPLKVPVPDGVEMVEHAKPDKGEEYWVYRTDQAGKAIAAFYEQEGGICQYAPATGFGGPPPEGVSHQVAHCQGQKESAGLTLSWDVTIAEGYPGDEGPTVFRIYKYGEVN